MKQLRSKLKITSSFAVFALALFLAFVFLGKTASAADKIDVEYPVGTNIDGDRIFNEDNILPGWEKSKTIRVENKSTTDDTDLYFTFDVKNGSELAGKLKLYVIRDSDNSYRIGGAGDRYTLKEADGKRLYVDKLKATKAKEYKIKIKFDENAGNEYQNLETKFDIDFRIESEVSEGGGAASTERAILAGQGRGGFTGNAEIQGAETNNGEPVVNEQAGETLGATGAGTTCQSWPLWEWILALVIFTLNFWRNARKNYVEEKYKWIVPFVWTILAALFWYFFDKCRIYQWFLYGSIIIAIVSHFAYLYFLRRKIEKYKKVEPKIE